MDNNFNTSGVLTENPVNQTGANQGDSWNKMSSGPAALAQALILELLGLYAQIISEQTEQRKSMTEAQIKQAEAQSTATEKEGDAAFSSGLTAGLITGCTAIAGVGAFFGIQGVKNSGLNEELETLSAENKPMANMEKLMSAKSSSSGSAGDDIARQASPSDTLKQEFIGGDYRNGLNDDAKEAIDSLKNDRAAYEKFKEEFIDKFNRSNESIHNILLKRNSSDQLASMANQTVSAVGQGGSGIATGSGQKAQAQNRAQAGLSSTGSQMAGSSESNYAQQVSKAYDAEMQVVQLLDKIRQASTVNG